MPNCTAFIPAKGVTEQALADAAQFASMADETPEGRSITVLAKQKFKLRERDLSSHKTSFEPFTAQTRMSGVDIESADGAVRKLRKGAGAQFDPKVVEGFLRVEERLFRKTAAS